MDKVLEPYNIPLNRYIHIIYIYSIYIKISFSIFYFEWLLSCLLILFLYFAFSLNFCSRHILDQFLIDSYLIILLVNSDPFFLPTLPFYFSLPRYFFLLILYSGFLCIFSFSFQLFPFIFLFVGTFFFWFCIMAFLYFLF